MSARTPMITLAAVMAGGAGVLIAAAASEPEPAAAPAPLIAATSTPAPTTSAGTSASGSAPASPTSSTSSAEPSNLPARALYYGKVRGVGSLAVALRPDGEAVAYLCGPRIEAWTTGAAVDNVAKLSGGGARLSLVSGVAALKSTVWVGDAKIAVTLRPVTGLPPLDDGQVRQYALGELR